MPTATTDTPADQGPGLEDAARRMEGLLNLPGDTSEPADRADEEAPVEKDEGVAADAESNETTAAEEEAETDEAEASEADGADEATDDKGPQTVTVTIDGKTETIPLEEALRGYQRRTDYTRKTQELATERQKIVAERQAAQEERQTYAAMLTALKDQLQTTQPQEPNWDEVYEADPVGYARRRDEWRDKQEKIAAAQFELSRLQQLQQQENAQNLQKMVTEGRAKMLDLYPAWKDQKVWENDRQAIVRYAHEVAGYSTEEIAQAYDPRAIVTMNKARLYDELMAKKPRPVAAKGPRVASAGAAPETGAAPKLNAAQQRLAKSGRIEDAAKLFEQLI